MTVEVYIIQNPIVVSYVAMVSRQIAVRPSHTFEPNVRLVQIHYWDIPVSYNVKEGQPTNF